ncbi:MAG: sigma-70 family RNA polymerase sigma factor [Planctomycetes bacterium]|nr:sigma-70 family RNA polymerase sigma factor [Planctomycetota bacterium]
MRETEIGGPGGEWASTLWSTALRARDPEALERLAARYWKPVYFFIRAKGKDVETAKDLTQSFFAYVLEKEILDRKNETGSFRAFLRGVLDRFLSDQYDRERAIKRGGQAARVSWDFAEAETDFSSQKGTDPEQAFLRSCAAETVMRVLDRLREERAEGYELLRLRFGFEGESSDYAQIERRLGLSEADVTNRLHRAKARFRDLLIEELRQTAATPEDLEEELRLFRRVF